MGLEPGKRWGHCRQWVREFRYWLIAAALAFAVIWLLDLYVVNVSTVIGHSMLPTLRDGEKLLVNKAAMTLAHPKRGDIVVLRDPAAGSDRKAYLVKRVIALPEDIVEVRNHKLYVNGKLLSEPYIDTEIEDPDFAALTVESGHYFVMGDNRRAGESKDSRFFGTVALEQIEGKAACIWWPLSRFSGL